MKKIYLLPVTWFVVITLIAALASCSTCKTGYCDAYGANDVPTEIDKV